MFLDTVGLSTWRWNNNLKSIGLLAAFPVLLLVLLWLIVLVSGMFLADARGLVPPEGAALFGLPYQAMPPLLLAETSVMLLWPWVTGGALAWTAAGYFLHGAMLRGGFPANKVSRIRTVIDPTTAE